MKKIPILLSILLLSSCSSIQFVTGRDVPTEPSFTVITTYGISSDLGYASSLESVLIDLGLSVVSPPARISTTKSIDKQNSEGKAAALSDSAMVAEQREIGAFAVKVIEEYKYLDQTTASYIIRVDSINRTFKVVKKDTKEVLAVLNNISNPKHGKWVIRDAFKSLGFKVRDKKYK